jgi:hypothetical protein
MTEHRTNVTREEVIRRYVAYDRGKKKQNSLDMENWQWNDPDCIDLKLATNGLKKGVLAGYRTWKLVELSVADLLECAVVNHIFPGEPQTLSQLVLRGKLAEWLPTGNPEWWRLVGNGLDLGVESALIVREAVNNEAPAKWYVEDGSGRVLASLQRILRYGETRRTVWAYIGNEPDERSTFIKEHPELKH